MVSACVFRPLTSDPAGGVGQPFLVSEVHRRSLRVIVRLLVGTAAPLQLVSEHQLLVDELIDVLVVMPAANMDAACLEVRA